MGLSGCYERRYGKHAVRPPDDLCEVAMAEMPNLSCRMNEVTAAVMRPLIANLPQRVEAYNRRYDPVVKVLREEAGDVVVVPTQDERVGTVGDHLNFYLTGVTDEQNALFRQTCVAMGVPVSWFQSKVNARWHVNWRKYGSPTFDLPNTDEVLRFAYDLKMPPTSTTRTSRPSPRSSPMPRKSRLATSSRRRLASPVRNPLPCGGPLCGPSA